MAKKKLTLEDMLVPVDEIPYEVPENWCWVKLGSISEVKGGKRLPKGKKLLDERTEYPYIRVADFDNGSIDLEKVKYIDEETRESIKNYYINNNDVYISIAGTIGKVGIIPDILDGANLTENAAKITNLTGITNKYLSLVMQSEQIQFYIKESTVSTSQPKLALFRIKELPIPLPPLAEQERIVNRIESLFDKVDRAAELVDEARDGFDKRKTSILEKGFKGEVIGKNYTDLTNLGELIIEISSGFACGKQNEISKEDDGAYPHFRPNNVGFYNQFNYDKIVYIPKDKVQNGKDALNKGDIIFNNTNSTELVGRAVVVREDMNTAFSNHLTRIRVDESKVTPEWVAYCINTLWKQGYFASICKQWVGQSGVNQDMLKKEVAIPVPPINEQRRVVDILDKLLEKEIEIEECSNINKSIEDIRKSILAKAFRGELGSNDLNEGSSIELIKDMLNS